MYQQVDREFGRIDIVANIPGGNILGHPEEITVEHFTKVLHATLVSKFISCQEAGRRMLARGKGSIINMSSIGGVRALGRGNFAYSVGQAGVIQMTRELSTEWADRGVRVQCHHAGADHQPRLRGPHGQHAGPARAFPARHPDRAAWACPTTSRGVVMFLASDASSFVTGTVSALRRRQPGDGRQRHDWPQGGLRSNPMSNPRTSSPDRTQLLSLYRTMLIIRRTEELLVKFYATGKLYGGVHTYIGEEAVAAGVCAHLRDDDTVFSTHRGHGHALAKGVTPRELIAEVMGRATGCSGGRGGSMHLFKPEVGFMGSSGIVGPCITLAAGGGYSAMLLKTDRVSVAFFGDGASNNGAFHEGINLATAWKLPAIFVCENNLYATEVPFGKATGNPDIASRAAAYGLPGVAVDGNDVLAVYQAAGEAVARARAGGGPTLIECRTYRTRAHAEGMRDAGYRTQEEIAAWKERDPIQLFREQAAGRRAALTEAELDAIDAEIKALVEEAGKLRRDQPAARSGDGERARVLSAWLQLKLAAPRLPGTPPGPAAAS